MSLCSGCQLAFPSRANRGAATIAPIPVTPRAAELETTGRDYDLTVSAATPAMLAYIARI